MNLQNDGPVSVDYQSHDAEVTETISLMYLHPKDSLTETYQIGDVRDPDEPVECTGERQG